MKKVLSVILCGAMLLSFSVLMYGCGNSASTVGSENSYTIDGNENNSTIDGSENNPSIVGKWLGYVCTDVYEPSKTEFELFEDGSCVGFNSPYYEVNDNGTIVFLDKYHYENVTFNYILEGNKLWMTNVKHGEPDTSSDLYFERID